MTRTHEKVSSDHLRRDAYLYVRQSTIRQVFENLAAVAAAAGCGLSDVVKLTVYLTDIGDFPRVNEIMAQYFDEPYPARAAVGVVALPKAAAVEMDAILVA